MHKLWLQLTKRYLFPGKATLFNLDKGPSDEWFRKLEKANPDIRFRKSHSEDVARSQMSNQKVMDDFFIFWSNTLKEHGLTDKPAQVYFNYNFHLTSIIIM